MTARLLELSERVCEQIANHQGATQVEVFARSLLDKRADAFAGLPGGAAGELAGRLAPRLATEQLRLLAELPAMIRTIAAATGQLEQPPALRLMQVAALAYLVNPDDLLPDELPAGYGFIDDAIVLRATVATLPQIYGIGGEEIAKQRLAIDFHGLCIPREVAPALVHSVHASVALVHKLGHLPPALVEGSIDALMNDPLARVQSQAPEQGGWGVTSSSWYRLPEGVVEARPDGGIFYRLGNERGVVLTGDGLARGG